MRKSWLLCVLMGTLAWGQAQPGTAPAQASPAQAPSAENKAPAPPAELPENAVVLTIKGVCPPAPKTATASKAGAGKTAAAPAKKPADCKTEITRAQFEKLTKALQQGPNPLNAQQKRQLATVLPRFMALSAAAKAQGLDKSERFKEQMKFYTMQLLTQELQHKVQDDADKIPPEKIAAYYKEHTEAYEQFSLDRLFIPRNKTPEAEDKDEVKEPEKLTEEQQKVKEAADKAKQEQGEQELTKLADSLRERAAAGEDFAKLQKEGFEAAGTKVENPTVNLPKVRRGGLPQTQAPVFDLKVGEVSAVISDAGGHYIFKVVSKEVLPLDQQLQTEIHNKLKTESAKETMDKYTNSFSAVPNEAYFGAAGPAGAPPPRMRGQMPPRPMPPAQPQGAGGGAPQPAAPPATNPPAQPPAAPAPPAKPN
jgi:hypothetical protein